MQRAGNASAHKQREEGTVPAVCLQACSHKPEAATMKVMITRPRKTSAGESADGGPATKRVHRRAAARDEFAGVRLAGLQTALELTSEEMAAVKAAVYGRCELKRKVMSWAQTSKFMLDPLIERFLLQAKVTKDDVFIDLGSGVGNVVESVATRVGCRCIGIELNEHNYKLSVEAASHFRQFREENQLPNPSVEYVHGDLTKLWDMVVKEGTVVWCSNKLFPTGLDMFMSDGIKDLKPGARMMMMKDLLVHTDRDNGLQWEDSFKWFDFDSITWDESDEKCVEWSDGPGKVHIYKRTEYVRQEGE